MKIQILSYGTDGLDRISKNEASESAENSLNAQ